MGDGNSLALPCQALLKSRVLDRHTHMLPTGCLTLDQRHLKLNRSHSLGRVNEPGTLLVSLSYKALKEAKCCALHSELLPPSLL